MFCTLLESRYVLGWAHGNPPLTTRGDTPPFNPIVRVASALAWQYPCDAHALPYYVPGSANLPRINDGEPLAILAQHGIPLLYGSIWIDLDAPDHDGRDGQWAATQILRARQGWTGLAWYLTRGGARLVWLLEPALTRDQYMIVMTRLRHALTVVGVQGIDEACTKDPGRCYRLPQTVREGGDGAVEDRPRDFTGLGPLDVQALPDVAILADTNRPNDRDSFTLPLTIVEGERDRTLFRYAAKLRADGLPDERIIDALLSANSARCKPPLNEHAVKRIARSVNRYPITPEAMQTVERPTIHVRVGDLDGVVDACERAMAQNNVFQRGSELIGLSCPIDGHGAPFLYHWQTDGLRVLAAECADWVRYKLTDDGPEPVPCDPPRDIVAGLRDRGLWRYLRVLDGVVETPALRVDGSLLTVPGYDAPSRLIYVPNGDTWPNIPDEPSKAQALAALTILDDLLSEFPFAEPCHHSAALAALLTAIGRTAIDGPTPLFLIDATTPAAGKGQLAALVAHLATGRPPAVMAQTEDTELEKRITALLSSGERVILIDNVTAPLGGSALDAVLTADVWSGRRLGQTAMVRVPNNATWLTTANNVQVRGDLARRCLRTYLTPNEERPENRVFRRPNLTGWAMSHRAEIVSAGLTILRAGLAHARETVLKPFGSFLSWSRVIRAPLIWLGRVDPLVTQDEIRHDSDTTAFAFYSVLMALKTAFGTQPFLCQQVVDWSNGLGNDAQTRARLRDALLELAADDRGGISARKLGYVFRRFRGRIFGDSLLSRADKNLAGFAWQVSKRDQKSLGVSCTVPD